MSTHRVYGNKVPHGALPGRQRGEPDGAGEYRAIPCGEYSEYELAIMHRERWRLSWVEDNVIFDRVVAPLDLETCRGAEYLIAVDEAGSRLRIRLDRIRRHRPAGPAE